ncbi:MAG: MATE family efflux transporter [Proteobacteria bacterium]|nr:MATE family efflux transporter [Pseudomonadota bacterium]
MKKTDYLEKLRNGDALSRKQLIHLTITLSLPAIFAQISSIVMQYIDASMVGHLGSEAAASIGLVSTTTWLFGGLCMAMNIGFTVQIAQAIGAKEDKKARNLVRLGLLAALVFSLTLLGIGTAISNWLPHWLGGSDDIIPNARWYFLIFALSMPIFQLNRIAGGMIQASGNMKFPSILHILMCLLDVVFNAVLIFPSWTFSLFSTEITIPGAGLGVLGAALGTTLAELVIACFMLFHLLFRSPALRIRRDEPLVIAKANLIKALKIALPVGFEQVVMCGAYIASTKIVAPLGVTAIAANSFGITAESLCYMPGYGIGAAATTLIGQSIGAKRHDLTRKLAWLTTSLGVTVMTATGALMFIFAPEMIALLSPDPEIQTLGTIILRIEAFAEPLYGASIVANGVFRGAGDTLVPSIFNFSCMWLVRIPLAAVLASSMGLKGVWIAMCIELCCRGILFLIRLSGKRWQNKKHAASAPN